MIHKHIIYTHIYICVYAYVYPLSGVELQRHAFARRCGNRGGCSLSKHARRFMFQGSGGKSPGWNPYLPETVLKCLELILQGLFLQKVFLHTRAPCSQQIERPCLDHQKMHYVISLTIPATTSSSMTSS